MADQLDPTQQKPGLPRKKATPEEREQVHAFAQQGMSNKEIATTLGLHGHTVNGIIRALKLHSDPNFKPFAMGSSSATLSAPPSVVENLMPKLPVGQNPQPVPSSSSVTPDDFTGGRPILGAPGGFTGAQQLVKYTVERISPPDGHLGTHQGVFTVDELGQIYGSGTYKVTRQEPGKAVGAEFVQKMAESYGPPRFPNNVSHRPQTPMHRPAPMFSRPVQERQQDDDGHERPAYRPFGYPRAEAPSGDRNLVEFARQANSSHNSALDKAFDMLGAIHNKSIEQIEAARKSAPETHFTKFLETQQEIMNARFEQERSRDLERRAGEEEKHERQRREDRERWERDQDAAKQTHDRELGRIKAENEAKLLEARATGEERDRRERSDREERERRAAEERKFLLDLEDRKMGIIRQEAEIQQKRLEAELIRSREEMAILQARTSEELKETREATAKHIDESNKTLTQQLDRDREALDREFKLKEKAQEREHELQRELLGMQKESIQNSGGDHIFNTINTVIKEFSKGLEKVVDLKKLEAMTPEAQAAAVARGSIDGNVVAPSGRDEAQPKPVAPASPAAQAPTQVATETEGGQARETEGNSVVAAVIETKMESVIRENLRKPFFREVLTEWGLHVQNCAETKTIDATTFANMYLEMMRDPHNDEARQGCAAFATFMKPRSWKKMYAVFKDAVDGETRASFELPEAAEFYNAFKCMVIEQIKDYWDQFLAAKVAAKAAPAVEVQAQAPVEPQGAPAQSSVQPAQEPPVTQTQESLRSVE